MKHVVSFCGLSHLLFWLICLSNSGNPQFFSSPAAVAVTAGRL